MSIGLDPERFDRLVRETHHQLRAQIAGMGVPSDAVDDVAQEVYLDLARQSERIPEGIELGRWLRGMARNCAYEFFRKRARQPERLQQIAELIATQPGMADEVDERPLLAALRGCVERLLPAHRAVVEAYYQAGRSAADIALDQGRSVGAVHMILSRLRDALRRCVRERVGSQV